jgi:hypothetical protein
VRASLKRWSLALALGALLGNGQPHEQAQADEGRPEGKRRTHERLVGEHAVRAAAARPGLELVLKRGFELKLGANVRAAELVLRVAKERAPSAEIDAGFVPVGPTVELLGAAGDVDVSFVADHFHVRAGHVLKLAVEGAGSCAGRSNCWQLLPARYENGRCSARAVPLAGGRMQFGSRPDASDAPAPSARSAAP